jgi:signal transduction histidine kinase
MCTAGALFMFFQPRSDFILAALRIVCVFLLSLSCTPFHASAEEPSTLTSVRSLLDDSRPQFQIVLRGTVTYNNRQLIVQDQTGAIAVEAPANANLNLGDEVEVHGQLEKRAGIPIIRGATVQDLWAGSTPLPLAMTPDEGAEGAYNGMLVSTEGRLIKITSDRSPRLRLTMESGSQLFTCILDSDPVPDASMPDVGATVRCTGVLALEQDTDALNTGTFLILMRNRDDIRVLAAAPWWTPRHLIFLFLLLLLLVWIGYRMHIRNIRARMSMIIDERSRIAREIHDTLAQGFAGIALQLQGLERTMEKRSTSTDAHLTMALHMVRRSRAEAHRSIATLRTLHSYQNLAAMAERLLKQLTQPAHLSLIVEQHGVACPFSDEATTQVLRISQEAVANIIEHARASTVTVSFDYQPAIFALTIVDDGIGFEPEHAKSLADGHFGIAGMKERAAQIGAEFLIESSAQGTRLRLLLPIRPTHSLRDRLRMRSRNSTHVAPRE